MKVEPVYHPSDTENGIIKAYYRASQRIRTASGAPIELIAMHAVRMDAVRDLIAQLQEYQTIITT